MFRNKLFRSKTGNQTNSLPADSISLWHWILLPPWWWSSSSQGTKVTSAKWPRFFFKKMNCFQDFVNYHF